MKYLIRLITSFFLFLFSFGASGQNNKDYTWPVVTKESKPWTRWWWMGSAVNSKDLTVLMEEYGKVGLGGVEITPIYGVKGYENQFINYLSPKWMAMLTHTILEAKRLGMGVDMAQASGWPFGGPWVKAQDACKNIVYSSYKLSSGQSIKEPISFVQKPVLTWAGQPVKINELKDPVIANVNLQSLALEQVRFEKEIPLQTLMAYSDRGEILDLTSKVGANKRLNWVAPKGRWVLYALFQGWHGKLVERAGPGGEGDVIDHFSRQAISNYLQHFDKAFSGNDMSGIRAFFNDSYEVDDALGQANWTPEILNEFKKRRGYDLCNYLPALFGNDKAEINKRVRSDYRETISDLLLVNFTAIWHRWAQKHGAVIRNQAHGSPGNLLDLYGLSDIPETEGNTILNIKMASSAANFFGKKLTSAESGTWENEHFMSNLASLKKTVDRFFLGGVNHVFYHGTNYSPPNESWPGWHFYASVELNPSNSLWEHFSTLNNYVTRVQSFLQSGHSDNEILLYYPIYDGFSNSGDNMLLNFHDIKREFPNSIFVKNAEFLWNSGYGFDYISDNQIKQLTVSDKLLQTKNVKYRTIVFSKPELIPVSTFKYVLNLANDGATIVFYNNLPVDVPGLSNLKQRRDEFRALLSKLHFTIEKSGVKKAKVGKGQVILGDNMKLLLNYVQIQRERMIDLGLQFLRRKSENGHYYFIANWSNHKVNGWIPLSANLNTAVIFNPMTHESGTANVKGRQIYVQLEPGESCILQTFKKKFSGSAYPYFEPAGKSINIKGTWNLEFIKGGQILPGMIKTDTLKSWTEFNEEDVKSFSGTVKYTISLQKNLGRAAAWRLELGKVCESAQVILNGKILATLIGPDYHLNISGNEFKDNNILEIKVSNLMANRIAEMDRKNIQWRKFYNLNFIALLKENRNDEDQFDFSNHPPTPSGLLNEITLTPLKPIDNHK